LASDESSLELGMFKFKGGIHGIIFLETVCDFFLPAFYGFACKFIFSVVLSDFLNIVVG
jgi:hypothetical protein